MASTLSLLRSPRFLPIYIAQFLGVFNDNVFKSALFIIVAFELTNSPEKAGVINNLAALLLILPYFMLSTLAGQLADRGRKAFMIQNNKIAEIIISLLATLSLFFQNAGFMIFILFLLGAQSAMFGPNKFAILPQLLSRKELVTGNALITSGTFIATLLGMLIGSLLAQQNHTWIWVGGTCTTAAFIGYLSARQLPETDIGDQHLKINWNLHKQTHLLLRIARNSPRIWSSILAISWFWFLTIAFLTQMPTIIRYLAATDESAMSLVLGVFILGIGAGCALSTYISSHKAETGIAPIVLAILSFFTISLAITTGQVGAALDQPLFHLNDFLNTSYGKTLIYKFFLIGLCLGAFGLPCYTELQEATRTRNRARIISINNVLNATFMLISSVVAIALLGILKINLQNYLLFIALFNLLFAFYLYKKTSHRVLRFLAQIASHLLYKIDKQGIEKLPLDGAAILVCNHVSYADAIVLYGSYKRPIRFLIYKSIYDHPALTWAFRDSRTIPLCSPLEDRKAYEQAMATAIQSLKKGEVLCIFPEGRLSPDGNIHNFHRGVEKLIEGHPTDVYPMALRGLAGSFFSRINGSAFSLKKITLGKLIRRRERLCLAIGDAVPANKVNAAKLESKVRALYGK